MRIRRTLLAGGVVVGVAAVAARARRARGEASFTALVLRRAMRALLKPTSWDADVEDGRRRIGGAPAPSLLGPGVTRRSFTPGELGPAPGEWIGVGTDCRRVLYLHGGYYLAGSIGTYRTLAAQLARGLCADVAVLDYRLAPEHPFPAALDDTFDAYRALLATGVDPAAVAVAGDSAGGGLALALLLRLKAEGLPLPGAAALLSPWTDLTCTNPSVDANDAVDDVLTAAALRSAAAMYAGSHPLDDPSISPGLGDLSGLPPLFVTVDGSEALLDDSLRLAERASSAGTACELHHTTGLFHVWPVLVPFLPEARTTVTELVAFLDRSLIS